MPDFTQWTVADPLSTNVLFNPMATWTRRSRIINRRMRQPRYQSPAEARRSSRRRKLDAHRGRQSADRLPDPAATTGTPSALADVTAMFEQKMGLAEGGSDPIAGQ